MNYLESVLKSLPHPWIQESVLKSLPHPWCQLRSVRCCWASQPTAFTTQNTVPKVVRFLLTPI